MEYIGKRIQKSRDDGRRLKVKGLHPDTTSEELLVHVPLFRSYFHNRELHKPAMWTRASLVVHLKLLPWSIATVGTPKRQSESLTSIDLRVTRLRFSLPSQDTRLLDTRTSSKRRQQQLQVWSTVSERRHPKARRARGQRSPRSEPTEWLWHGMLTC